MDSLSVNTRYSFSVPRCSKKRAGIGWKHSPQELSVANDYTLGSDADEITELNELLVVKLFVEPEGSEYADVSSSGVELNPVDEIGRIGTLKEFAVVLQRINPDDDSEGPDSVTVTFSSQLASALGFTAAAMTKTLKTGELLTFSNPEGNTVPAGARITVVNDDTVRDCTVTAFFAGFKP